MPAQMFEKAADHTRPYGSHRYDVFAPKLRRSVTLFGRDALDAWTFLESDPSVISYCERPMVVPKATPKRVVDFWVKTKDADQFWILLRSSEVDEEDAPNLTPELSSWCTSRQHTVKLINPDDLTVNKNLLDNWGWIIRDLSAFGRLVDKKFLDAVRKAITTPTELGGLETEFFERDPILVRVAAFLLIHLGQAHCRSLGDERISPSTVIEAL
ncbi:hypothetical protein [Massilia sp. TWP1-3-3]|uniref:hypothetical protein n=1 Tax=Massilia sp. TWP1-3-3 TaxID=2804573 RepID=UPI003CE95675